MARKSGSCLIDIRDYFSGVQYTSDIRVMAEHNRIKIIHHWSSSINKIKLSCAIDPQPLLPKPSWYWRKLLKWRTLADWNLMIFRKRKMNSKLSPRFQCFVAPFDFKFPNGTFATGFLWQHFWNNYQEKKIQ